MAEENIIYTDPIRNVTITETGNGAYAVKSADAEGRLNWIQRLQFQNGALADNGVNGFHNEDMLAILISRLTALNEKLPCGENAAALRHLEEATRLLNQRTQNRVQRGVEGTEEK